MQPERGMINSFLDPAGMWVLVTPPAKAPTLAKENLMLPTQRVRPWGKQNPHEFLLSMIDMRSPLNQFHVIYCVFFKRVIIIT